MRKATDTKFRRYLVSRGVTAWQLAKAVGLPYMTVARYVNGIVAHPRADNLARIAEALGCRLEDIY